MRQSILRKTRYLLVAVMALMFSFAAIFMSMPNAKAASEIDGYKLVESMDLMAIHNDASLTSVGSFTLSKKRDTSNSEPSIAWRGEQEGDSASVTFTNTSGKKITYFSITVDVAYYLDEVRNDEMKVEVKDGTTTIASQTVYGSDNNVTISKSSTSGFSNTITLTFTETANPKFGSYIQMWLHEFSVYEDDPGKPVNITAGTGIKSAYLSTNENATSGSESGTGFEDGTVYGFVTLKEGYNADSNWTRISPTGDVEDAIYRVGSVMVDMESAAESYNIGTFNATPKTMTLTPKGNGIDDLDDVTLTYDQAATINAPTESRTGCTFSGWNTEADGLGDSYGTELSVYDVNELILSDTTLLYAKWTYVDAIQNVITEIKNITVDYTDECKEAIDTAYSHYDALSADYKSVFPETSYNLLESKNNAYTAMDKINSITTPENTTTWKALVNTAKSYYDELNNDAKTLVKSAFVTKLDDSVAILGVLDKINAIDTLDESSECRDKIDEAIQAYTDLTTSQTNVFPEDAYDALNDKDDAKKVIDKIKEIGNVEYTSESKTKIDAAQTAYDSLTGSKKEYVTNVNKLEQANTDYNKVDEAVAKINALPTFEYTSEFKELLDEIEEYYETLTDYQKSIVPTDSLTKYNDVVNQYKAIDDIVNIGKIDNTKECIKKVRKAKETYDSLTDSQKAAIPTDKVEYLEDAIAVVDVMEEINSVKNAGYSDKDKQNIDNARKDYNALTDTQKGMFPFESINLLINIEKVYPIMIMINQIGTVQYTSEYKEKLDNAKNVYNELNDQEKALVRNYVVLSVYIQSYNRVDEAYNAIESINKIKYNKASREILEDARKKYNKLSDKEKELIPNEEEKLLKAEKKYEKAEHSHNVGMAWLIAICVIFGVVIVATGTWLLIIFILKKKKANKPEENKKNNKKTKK